MIASKNIVTNNTRLYIPVMPLYKLLLSSVAGWV